MLCGLPKRETRMSAVRMALCTAMEIARERRRMLRWRLRCSASPSMRHPRNEPRPPSEISSEAFWGSGDITHLHRISARLDRSAVARSEMTEILRRRFPGGCSRTPGDRRRARRDVRLRASSQSWTPGLGTSSLSPRRELTLEAMGTPSRLEAYSKSITTNKLQKIVSGLSARASYVLWTWILGGQFRWTGVMLSR